MNLNPYFSSYSLFNKTSFCSTSISVLSPCSSFDNADNLEAPICGWALITISLSDGEREWVIDRDLVIRSEYDVNGFSLKRADERGGEGSNRMDMVFEKMESSGILY